MTLRTRHLNCTVPNDLPEVSHYSRLPHLSAALLTVYHDIVLDVLLSNPTASAEAVAEEIASLVKATVLAEWDVVDEGHNTDSQAKAIRDRYVARIEKQNAAAEWRAFCRVWDGEFAELYCRWFKNHGQHPEEQNAIAEWRAICRAKHSEFAEASDRWSEKYGQCLT